MKGSPKGQVRDLLTDLDELRSKIEKAENALTGAGVESSGDRMGMTGGEKFVRQGLLARLVHFSHLIFVVSLVLTGLVILYPGMLPWFSRSTIRAVHLWVSLLFVAVPLLGGVLAPLATVQFMSEFLAWSLNDLTWLVRFPFRLFQPHRKIDAPVIRTKINPGQRLLGSSVMTVLVLLSASGAVRLLPGTFPPAVIARAEAIHRVAFPILLFLMSGHMMIGSGIFEIYRDVWRSMFGDGTVTRRLAEEHWPYWLRQNESGRWPPPVSTVTMLRAAGVFLWLAAVTFALLFIGT